MIWKVPSDDGGSPIKGYYVEKREQTRHSWQEVGSCVSLEQLVDGLQEGFKYMFHVAAENKYGRGEFVELPEPVTAKHPFGMYKSKNSI